MEKKNVRFEAHVGDEGGQEHDNTSTWEMQQHGSQTNQINPHIRQSRPRLPPTRLDCRNYITVHNNPVRRIDPLLLRQEFRLHRRWGHDKPRQDSEEEGRDGFKDENPLPSLEVPFPGEL